MGNGAKGREEIEVGVSERRGETEVGEKTGGGR